jgi:hypothetical protein
MAIVLTGSTVEIDSGFASGTATGGTANTLTGTGFSTAWANRIVWITGGTGSGQSRFIRTATTTTLTVEPNWDIIPDATSVFSIGYTWNDIDTALAGVTQTSPNFYLVPYNFSLKIGGFLGSINEGVRFTVSPPTLTPGQLASAQGSLWHQGRLLSSGVGVGGGTIEIAYAPTASFNNQILKGLVRWYRAQFAALPGTGSYRINHEPLPKDALDIRDCLFNNIYVVPWTGDRVDRSVFVTKPFWPKGAVPPALTDLSFIENAVIVSGDSGAGENSHYFGLTFQGVLQDTTFNRPYWVWNTTTKEGTYFWDTSAPAYANTFAATTWSANTSSSAGFHTGYTVNVFTRLANGAAAPSTVVGLWDSSGNAAWFEAANAADGRPINSMTITTNASGNYANPWPAVSGKSGLVVAQRLKQTGATAFGPWTIRARNYGYLETGGARSYQNGATEALFMLVDPAITQTNGATVAAYTTLENPAKFYDRYQYYLSLAANIKIDNGLSRSGSLINAGNYNVIIDATAAQAFSLVGNTITIKASTFTGNMTTTGLITLVNGATFFGARTDATGTITVTNFLISNIIAGSRVLIRRTDTQIVLINQSVVGSSFLYEYQHTADIPIEIVVRNASGSPAYQEWRTTVTLTSSGGSATANQVLDE